MIQYSGWRRTETRRACVHMQTWMMRTGEVAGARTIDLVQSVREASTRTSLLSFVVPRVHRSHACTISLGLLCLCRPDHESLPHLLISFVLGHSFMQQPLASSLMEDMHACCLLGSLSGVCPPHESMCCNWSMIIIHHVYLFVEMMWATSLMVRFIPCIIILWCYVLHRWHGWMSWIKWSLQKSIQGKEKLVGPLA